MGIADGHSGLTSLEACSAAQPLPGKGLDLLEQAPQFLKMRRFAAVLIATRLQAEALRRLLVRAQPAGSRQQHFLLGGRMT